ncbi:MAG TPA: hypothetical protein VE959_06825 [Bryobacteraceae bacterium]|nr:hypothetical protein [Bryobacteraceae bacterium]
MEALSDENASRLRPVSFSARNLPDRLFGLRMKAQLFGGIAGRLRTAILDPPASQLVQQRGDGSPFAARLGLESGLDFG